MPTLADIYSAIDSAKRRGSDFVQNPGASLQQMVGLANDRAGALNELTSQAAMEGGSYGPKSQQLANQMAEGYNPAGMMTGLKTIKTRVGNGVEISVTPDATVPNMKFFIDETGQANLKINPTFANDMSYVKDRHFRAVDDFLWPHGDDVYVRGANSKDDFEFLKNKTHRGSKNWATNEQEGGLSVGRGVEATMFPYSYLVKGKKIGFGSDSEPLLDLTSAKPIGKLMTQKQMQVFLKEAEAKKLKSLGIEDYQIRALKSVPVLKNKG